MSKYKISTVFSAIDKMSAPISKMQSRIGKMTASAEMGMRKLDGGMTRISKNIFKVGAAGVAAAGLLTVALNHLGGELDVLAKTARRLDMPIDDLQKFRFIGEQSGITVNEMDKALGTFTKRLGEAKDGTGALYSGIKKSNPALLTQLTNAKSVTEAFDLYTDAIRATSDPTKQAALASFAYSKSGMKLIQVSHNSADALAEMRKQAEQNGLVTQKQAEDAEAYNDAQNRLSKTLSGFLTSVLVPLYPMMTKIIDEMRNWGVANRELVASGVTEYVGKFIGFVKEYAQYIPAILKFTAAFIALNAALKGTIAVMTLLNLVMMANPVSLIIMAIVAAIALMAAAATAIYLNWDSIVDYFKGWGETIKNIFFGFIDVVKLVFSYSPMGLIINNWGSIVDYFTIVGQRIKDIFFGFIDMIKMVFGYSPMGLIINNWGQITGYFTDLFSGIVDIYENTLGAVMSGIRSAKDFLFGEDEVNVNGNQNVTYDYLASPQDRVARSIEERKETFDINVRAEQGSYVSSYNKPTGRLNIMNSGT